MPILPQLLFAAAQWEESLSEYLNSVHSFLPLRDKASGEFFIVHVNQNKS